MDADENQDMNSLNARRGELRSKLAQAWEMREPLDQIRDIEEQIRDIWDQLDELDSIACKS